MSARLDRTLAWLSARAYDDPPDADALEALRFGLLDHYDHRGTQAILVSDGECAVLASRGTEASRLKFGDIASNLGRPVPWAGKGLVHSGYAGQLEKIRWQSRRFAEGVSASIPLYVTGHSMGGALAALFAAFWYALPNGYKLAGLVTFGAPKSMTAEAAAPIACPVRRYVNRFDFAPWWPPTLRLVSPGTEIAVDSGGWPGPMSRHGVDRYVEALEARR